MDSESDWDSPTERVVSPKDGPPKIELTSGEETVSPRKPKPRQGLKPATNKDVKFSSDGFKKDKAIDKQGKKRNLQNDAGPPYDFRGEITDDKDNAVNASKTEAPPGLSRKGDLYEPGQQWRNVSHAMGENDNDVVLGVPMQKMPSNQTPGSRTTSPNHLNIQVLNTKAVYEPADNLVDSYGNKRVYIFDGPVTDYYRTNLKPEVPKAKMEEVADVVEKWIYRGWREFFGILRIILSFITISLLELYKFIIGQTLMPIVIKLSDMMGGYVIKPFLSTIFNNFFQPCFVFWHNIGAGFGLVLAPIIDIFKAAAGVVTKIIGAFRLVTVTIDKRHIDHVDRIENV
ncbi:uncharacterized protein LOC135492873 isoform X3 [Lineus longissimus]|uniref:uncharacterized protein LOC135492873 isoform X3 n=1 Tax=Lineus longissimus TaxID=88925 RepID=UPI00315CF655